MLRRGHHAQTKAARKTKGRQKTDEIDRFSAYSAGSLHRSAKGVNGNIDSALVSLPDGATRRRYVPAGPEIGQGPVRPAGAGKDTGHFQGDARIERGDRSGGEARGNSRGYEEPRAGCQRE